MSDNREYRSRRFAQLVGLELKGEFAKHSISQTKVAEILGHSNVNITLNRYVHPNLETKRSAINSIVIP